jgi:hypothetical protein
MLAIVFANEPDTNDSASAHVLAELRSLGVPIAFGRAEDAPFGLPASCVWFVTETAGDAHDACDAGYQAVLVDSAQPAASMPEQRMHVIGGVSEVLELIREPYTRSVLNLRYIMRTVLAFD